MNINLPWSGPEHICLPYSIASMVFVCVCDSVRGIVCAPCLCVCVCKCVCAYVCVRERERESEGTRLKYA